jgi:DNA-directed RNA polymerase specialized sigma24 family protein
MKTRRLSDAQKAQAEEAMAFVPSAVRAFVAKHPCYARLLPKCDLTSVAHMAVVEASFTYDATKSQPTTYYGSAIRHALLKEVRRLQRSRECANERVDFSKALNLKGTLDQRQQAIACLSLLPLEDRTLIEAHVLEGRSLMSLGRELDRDWRTIKARLTKAVELLRQCVSDHAGSSEDIPGDEP